MRIGLLLSILIHILIYSLFLNKIDNNNVIKVEEVNSTITIDLLSADQNPVDEKTSKSVSSSIGRNPVKNKSHSSTLNLTSTQAYYLHFGQNQPQTTYNTGNSSLDVPDNPYQEWGGGSTEFDRISDYSLLERLYEQINNILYYPGVFVGRNITGVVKTRMVIDSQGQCNWKYTQIQSKEVHLKIYVLSVLKKFCTSNLKLVTNLRKQMNLDMNFNFEFTERMKDKITENKRIVGNVFHFNRNAGKSKLQWNLGPLMGVFPFPAISIDFNWLQNNWEKYVNDRDLLEEFTQQHSS